MVHWSDPCPGTGHSQCDYTIKVQENRPLQIFVSENIFPFAVNFTGVILFNDFYVACKLNFISLNPECSSEKIEKLLCFLQSRPSFKCKFKRCSHVLGAELEIGRLVLNSALSNEVRGVFFTRVSVVVVLCILCLN